jgi:glc operon protein GlcG
MKICTLTAALLAAGLLMASAANAQQPSAPAPNPLDAVPEKMPFNTPYGAPISLEKAQAAVQAAAAEANKRGWALNVAVVDSGGSLVTFARMDGAQLASIAVAQHKARAAAKFRRPTKVFEEAMQKGFNYLETIDGIIASRGGIPLVEDGKLIGAIGCSGGTGSQDEVVCMAGAATINK